MEVNGQLHNPRRFNPGKTVTTIHWIGGWVGTKADIHALDKRSVVKIILTIFFFKMIL
jgi:hypothetical protein